MNSSLEKVFPSDIISKRQRVERTLKFEPVDRVAIHEQLSYNPKVIEFYTGRKIEGFEYTIDDICEVVRITLDMCFPPVEPRGTNQFENEDGLTIQNDNWTAWCVSRPFDDETGASQWLKKKTERILKNRFDAEEERGNYRQTMRDLQQKVGDTVILNYSLTGLCHLFHDMGLEIFAFFYMKFPDVLAEYLEISVSNELQRIHAIADPQLSPVILIPEDFAGKHGPIFSTDFLDIYHFPYVKRLTEAWHKHSIKVIYHSDGNWEKVIPDLIQCGVDGFYCLEPNCGMDIVELKNKWPNMVWAGGVDGVDLMERGSQQQVKKEVHRQIEETNALKTGGMFVASSSEINPPIKTENFQAMVEAVDDLRNPDPSS